MVIKTSVYKGSFTSDAQCPKPDKPEYAFIGRSNVGKSSLINMLTGRSALAHVSHTPGKTQSLNYYLINGDWYLVDLPGYGYAQVSKSRRDNWEQMMRRYLMKRENLQCVFLLIDARIPPQESDLAFANWMGMEQIPFVFVFTKTDDKKYNTSNIKTFEKSVMETWAQMPQYFLSSSRKGLGRDEILNFIEQINNQFAERDKE